MKTEAIFAASAAERRTVADLLESLDEGQLRTPSLCTGWDVRTVAAHLAGAVSPSKRAFMLALVRSTGNMHSANDATAREHARQPVAQIVETLRHADSRFAPPVVGPEGRWPTSWCTAATCGSRSGYRTTRRPTMCWVRWS